MMRCLAAVALLGGATAFSVPGGPRYVVESPSSATTPRAAKADAARSIGEPSESAWTSRFGFAGALTALLALRAASRSRAGSRHSSVVRHADVEKGYRNSSDDTNYVNPWEKKVEWESGDPNVSDKWDDKFVTYEGPVYKKVPVVEGLEGLEFPLDADLFEEPLEPPPPGAKWGEGRSADGNWYMEADGEKVQFWQGVGRRKTACAVVRLFKGTGQFIVNGKDAYEYFQNYPIWWLKAAEPMGAMSIKNSYDCIAKVFAGGKSGQAGAIRLAVARAMQEINYNWTPLMKKAKYLTFDVRYHESKKIGKKKARKSKPYHKR